MKRARGFTLVELAVVVVIIGVLAAFAVPRFLASVERSKASEAFNYLSAVQAAQERFHTANGTYAADLAQLEIKMKAPKHFTVGLFQAGSTGSLHSSWLLTLTRTGTAAGYGDYTVSFSEEGFSADGSSITDHQDIDPMQT